MSDKTGIEWTDATWNPVTGCDEVSPGCDHCYAKTFAERWRGTEGHYFENGFDVQLRPDKLTLPMRWRKPRKVFVNSMSDLFHKDVPEEYVARVFAVMALTPRHTYQVLTKRHARMRSLLREPGFWFEVRESVTRDLDRIWEARGLVRNPLPNVWLGVSAENQQWADIRIPALLDTPAAVHWVSAEPLLGPIQLKAYWLHGEPAWGPEYPEPTSPRLLVQDLVTKPKLDWVVVGGESGPGARPMTAQWARDIRDQCTAADLPYLFKQWGAHNAAGVRVGKGRAGRELDGHTWDGYPVAA